MSVRVLSHNDLEYVVRNSIHDLRYPAHTVTNIIDNIPILTMGLTVGSRHFYERNEVHRHGEIEMIFADGGDVAFDFGGVLCTLARGQVAIFWAIVPHLAAGCDDGALLWWVKVPTRQFFEWDMPDSLTTALLQGQFVRDGRPRPESFQAVQVREWERYLSSGGEIERKIVLLEVEARMRELAMNAVKPQVPVNAEKSPPKLSAHSDATPVDLMVTFIAHNYRSPLTVDDIALTANLKPTYAMRLFRARFGMTIMQYVALHRVAHAQRLLLTTDATVLDVLLESGFGSVTQFYTLFRRHCGCSPVDYRQARWIG